MLLSFSDKTRDILSNGNQGHSELLRQHPPLQRLINVPFSEDLAGLGDRIHSQAFGFGPHSPTVVSVPGSVASVVLRRCVAPKATQRAGFHWLEEADGPWLP